MECYLLVTFDEKTEIFTLSRHSHGISYTYRTFWCVVGFSFFLKYVLSCKACLFRWMLKRCLFTVILGTVNLYGKFCFMESIILQNRTKDFKYLNYTIFIFVRRNSLHNILLSCIEFLV